MTHIILGYRRKSVVRDQTDLVSPEQQAHACELWVQTHLPGSIIEWYEDVDRSGRTEEGRPGWQALLEQVERPEVAGVVAWSFDRMYRNVHQFLSFLNRLEELGKRLITVKESLDTTTPIGRAVVTILMVIAQLESDQTSERMQTGIKYRREVQGRHWGPTPYGCDRNEQGHLVPSERGYWFNSVTGESSNGDERPGEQWEPRRYYDGLRIIYQLYARGDYSYDLITDTLNCAGWRFLDRHGQPRPFDRDDIRRAVAYWRLFRGELPTGKIQRRQGDILEGGHQPVLPVELCDQVGQVLEGRRRKFGGPRSTAPRIYLLSGVAKCGACGMPLKGIYQNGLRRYRHQGRRQPGCPEAWTPADDIEREVLDYLTGLAEASLLEDVRAEAERLAREAFSKSENSRSILAELDRQRARLDRLEDLYLDGGIPRDRYEVKKAKISETTDKLENDLYAAGHLANFNQALERMTATLERLPLASEATKRALIYSVFETIEISGGKIQRAIPRPWAKGFF